MKTIVSKKALEKAVERALKAEYLVDTGAIGTVNLVLMQIDNIGFCETWAVESAEAIKGHVRFQAYGTKTDGEILISNYGKEQSVHIIGRGQDEHGLVLLVQRTDNVFTVVWNCDLAESRSVFFMTATDDHLLIQLILFLAQKHFPSIQYDEVERALSLLMGVDVNE